MTRGRIALLALLAAAMTLFVVQAVSAAQPLKKKPKKHHVVKKHKPKPLTPAQKLARVKHVVVIYEENHSFDNLYGGWEGVNGRANATAAQKAQVDQNGKAYACLLQLDVNLAAVQPQACSDTNPATGTAFTSAFPDPPFQIDTFIKPTDTTCPPNPNAAFSSPNGFKNGTGSPGGCTRDIVHEVYQEQYQLNNGAQNRYSTGSDAVGLTQGAYNTKALPIYAYLHSAGHPNYVILDDCFQAAFGGSYLNHQFLIAAQAPTYPSPPDALRSIIDSNA